MIWRDAIKDPPKVKGEYFVMHPRYGRCVYGWNDGWGWDNDENVLKPERWIDESN